jgi:high-affinity Fe2+/Pb2+ permease
MTTIICLVVLAGLNWLVLRWLANNVKGCDWGREQRVRRLLRSQVRVDVSEAVARAIGNRWP